ncbi:MAG: type II CRISPR RNA-guided endonuclease Cas9 [Bacilli bacterium]|nr:type II CRISPR RNA-guided endonuclease Cas9 [Bacilli bacterium]
MKKYNIGLDIGTTSVGWAVVDNETNKVIRKGNKKLWGVNLFEQANTAEARRMQRNTRRRYDRRRKRIKLLQNEFYNEISKVDNLFFKKLKESFYNDLDTVNKTIKINDKERKAYRIFAKKYPTIYHLRNELMFSNDKMDIRLVYLAIHHIIKYRGNFLYTNDINIENINSKDKLKELFELLNEKDFLDINENIINEFDYEKFDEIIKIENKKDRKMEFKKLFTCLGENIAKEISTMLVGDKFNVPNLFNIDTDQKFSISLKGTDYDDKYDELENLLEDNIEILELYKEIYNIIFIKQLFKNSNTPYISLSMVNKYNEHKEDLKFLKQVLKNNKELYKKMFKGNDCEYNKYIRNKYIYDDFRKKFDSSLEKIIKTMNNSDLVNSYYNKYKLKIENETFIPRITDTDNGKYPYQLNKIELIKIIENQGRFYPFLNEKIDGVYKLVKLLEFRIPYYVGPLNNTTSKSNLTNSNSWFVRNSNEIITPYNFEKVVNLDASAEKFIKNMISHCTYLLNEYAMPADSIMYSKFKLMNELKQIRVNTYKLSNDFQQKIINDLFMKSNKSITNSQFLNYLYQTSEYRNLGELKVTGYSSDKGFANSMKSYCDFFGEDGIFCDCDYNIDDAENIIEWITIFEDKSILEKKVKESYPNLNEKAIKKVLSRKYKGWSSLSKKLILTKYYEDKKTHEFYSILDLMEKTDENFMQIINNNKYNFQEFINNENELTNIDKLDYSVVSNLATSPANKKGIYQSLKILEEIINYIGYEPNKIIIEMSRGEEEKKRTDRRKDYLVKLYESSKEQIENYEFLMKELKEIENFNMKYFLYFIQEGKSLYSGKKLDINELNEYEIDHILPRTLIKDNSIDNLALVEKKENQDKGASLVLPKAFRNNYTIAFWNRLKDLKLISAKKLYRLTRNEYNKEDIEGFINRQLVETRQITKHVANIIKNYYKKTKVVYINAGLSHNYREKFELFKFRDLNDYHHAHDAYLAAVLGNYRTSIYGDNFDLDMHKDLFNRLIENKDYKNLNYGFFINSLDNNMKIFDEKTGEMIFDPETFNNIVKDTLYNNDIIVTKKPEIYTGEFFQQTKNKKGEYGVELKKNLPTEMYGSYTSLKCSYMCLVEYKNKKKLIGIPYLIDTKSKMNIEVKNDFIKKHLKLKDNESFIILKDRIPFNTLLKYKNHNVRIKGYSVAKANCEICNDIQFKVKKEMMNKWKIDLNSIYSKNVKIDEINEDNLNEIITYIINKINEQYYLYIKISDKLIDLLKDNILSKEDKIQLIKELLKMIHANSANANLKFLNTKGLDDRVGRLAGINITTGTIIYQSPAGLKENKYEF